MMKKLDIYYIYWLLSRATTTLGLWGLVGLGLVLGSIIFYIVKVEPLKQEIKTTQYELSNKKKGVMNIVRPQALTLQTTTQDISEFYKRFPSGASLPKWLHMIDEIAIKQHLILNRGDYRFSQTKQGQLLRYEIVMPLIGQYSQVHQFVTEVLKTLPALALSDLQIKRENSLSPTVEARLVFVLFLKGDSW
ncbi:type 4a pilus biogenesis protein PilO [Methylotenera sp.]|uniref:type 4a pilus biogenesis protein PilO n=1 Tax=Methylotenera sp. TaxID=2051956 RepID=UPI0024886A76|nr:type 4a pilus biogenesis protein PilO [Methylotenera sp.]MDI1298991.1 type 4a pilus biogenesis protein PilO [Methylotenera sp.]